MQHGKNLIGDHSSGCLAARALRAVHLVSAEALTSAHADGDRPGASWRVEPGPLGRGQCLVADLDQSLVLLLPPGVPVELPEDTSSLVQWRLADWVDGKLAEPPATVSLETVVRLANDKAGWALHQARLREELLKRAGLPVTETVEPLRQRLLDPTSDLGFDVRFEWRVRPTALTEHPRTFATEIAHLDDRDLVRKLRTLVDSAAAVEDCTAAARDLGYKVGENRMRVALLALLHVRARSRSWRATKWMASEEFEPQMLVAALAIAIDSAGSGLWLERRVSVLAEGRSDIEEVLVRILYLRSHSRRWLWTGPVRRALAGSTVLHVRGVVRRSTPATPGPPNSQLSCNAAGASDTDGSWLRRVV